MHYLIISFTYKNNSLELREALNLTTIKEHKDFLQSLIIEHAISEAMLCKTCNRIEIITFVNDEFLAKEVIFDKLALRSAINVKHLCLQADTYTHKAAMHHLFSVASSVESLVVGETQIVGQLKNAFKFAVANKFCSNGLKKSITHALACASKIRNNTSISTKPVSIASIAVLKANDELGSIKDLNALVIGSGDMSRIACQHLLNQGVKVTLINRSIKKALIIQEQLEQNIIVKPFKELKELLNINELLFTATSSTQPIITQKMVKECSFNRVWLDLAVPRDISTIDDENIKVIIVDDLVEIAKNNIGLRNSEVRSAYAIISEYTKVFFANSKTNEVEPLIKNMYVKAFNAVHVETQKATKKGFIPKEYESQAKKMGRQTMKRFLHSISKNMREASSTKSVAHMISSLAYLLDTNEIVNSDDSKMKET